MVKWFTKIPNWAALSLAMNGLLFLTLLAVSSETVPPAEGRPTTDEAFADEIIRNPLLEDPTVIDAAVSDDGGLPHPSDGQPRTYQDWLVVLADEAKSMAARHPEHLTILLGDSLSQWFPGELMPGRRVWINQSISGEKTKGLLDRLGLFSDNDVEAVFVMIGINDLIWGTSDEEILKNYKEIVRQLKAQHPETQIVVQSILPHGGEDATWESRDKLLALSPERIVRMNGELRKIADENDAYYLDLYPIFVTGDGSIRPDLTTDGLHLNRQGYLVWRSAIALYAQLELQ